MKRLTDLVDFGGTTISYDQFIDLDKPIADQVMKLASEMFQANIGRYVIDIGWTPDLDLKGEFIIYLVKDQDWENLVIKRRTTDIRELVGIVKDCLRRAQ